MHAEINDMYATIVEPKDIDPRTVDYKFITGDEWIKKRKIITELFLIMGLPLYMHNHLPQHLLSKYKGRLGPDLYIWSGLGACPVAVENCSEI